MTKMPFKHTHTDYPGWQHDSWFFETSRKRRTRFSIGFHLRHKFDRKEGEIFLEFRPAIQISRPKKLRWEHFEGIRFRDNVPKADFSANDQDHHEIYERNIPK